ncbi:MAG: hypothetical protein R3B06_24845 [Kofleriaceae bacterium]
MRSHLTAAALVVGLVAAPTLARAQPTCDPVAVEADRRALEREARAARTWNLSWTIAYGVFAAGQVGLALAEWAPGRGSFDDTAAASLYIGAGKAAIGAASRLVLPVRLPRVIASGDACRDRDAIVAARRVAARKERNAFWLQLGGGAALHLLGGGYLVVVEDSWRDAITSLAVGAVVSTVTLYTLPKRSWRHPPVVVAPTATTSSVGVAVVGSF